MDDKRQLQAVPTEPGDSLGTDIYSVHYQKLVSLGNFENERVGAWATVLPGQTAEDALAALKVWVGGQVGQHREVLNLQQQVNELRAEHDELALSIGKARDRWRRVKQFIESIGLRMPERFMPDDDMPW